MRDCTLKNIPDDLYRRLKAAAEEDFRTIDQEILFRLSRSFDVQDARNSAIHARWIQEALASGVPTSLKSDDVDAAFKRGVAKAKSRQAKAA